MRNEVVHTSRKQGKMILYLNGMPIAKRSFKTIEARRKIVNYWAAICMGQNAYIELRHNEIYKIAKKEVAKQEYESSLARLNEALVEVSYSTRVAQEKIIGEEKGSRCVTKARLLFYKTSYDKGITIPNIARFAGRGVSTVVLGLQAIREQLYGLPKEKIQSSKI